MKKLLLFTAALVAISATAALAASPGVNLSWANCATTAASGDKTNGCDGASGVVAAFQGTFRSATGIPDFAGCSSVVDLGFAGPVPDYWKTGSGECNSGALTIGNPTAAAPCATPNIFDVNFSGGGFAIDHPGPSKVRFRIDWATGAPTAPIVNAGALYPAFKLSLDPDAGVNTGCTGCEQPTCLVVNSIEVFGFATGEDYTITNADSRQYVTWQGGAIGGAGCPAATPSQNKTWGSVKALYR
jgi:hypothetical protein